VIGVSEVTKAFLPLLRKRGQDKIKKILNMSSLLGSVELMTTGDGLGYGGAYCVSKCAVNMLTKMFANQLASENIIVYASDPGWVKTDMGSQAAPLEMEESIAGQLAKLDSLTLEQAGGFYNYEGKTTPW
jgi:NAD(P)-dependent dehydrogenase (short-subunit alcohol dehydrogenase family)